MSVEKNKATLKRMYDEVWNKGNWSLVPELVSPDYQHRDYKGQEGWKQLVSSMRSAIPDLHDTLEQVIGEGDWLAYRVTGKGTFKGKLGDIEATGKKVQITQILFSQFKDGKLLATEAITDTLGMYQQMGVPPPGYQFAKK